jgi:hypothetical protein
MEPCPGGLAHLRAFTIMLTAISVPHSPETACPTCRIPSWATTFGARPTVDMPVSSKLYTLFPVKIPPIEGLVHSYKKLHDFFLIECSGVRQTGIFRIPERKIFMPFTKPCNQ